MANANKKIVLNTANQRILWFNVALLSVGVGVLVWVKFHNPLYTLAASLFIGIVEYVVMSYSLRRRQEKSGR